MDFSAKYYDPPNFRFGNPRTRRMRFPGKLASAAGIVLFLGIILTILNIYELHQMKEDHRVHTLAAPVSAVEAKPVIHNGAKKPIVWIYGKQLNGGYLKHVFAVFDRIGYTFGNDKDWDILWSHEYPFESLTSMMLNLKPHQRVNHFPGTGFVTNKVNLATSSMPYIPRAFKIPQNKQKFLEYTKLHPEKLWVQKRNTHRGIKIKKIEDLDLESDGSFIQEFVDKPFLIDKKKFDIGIYTVVTSINPLRLYIVEGEVLYRFCKVDYYPFDQTNTRKYVVGDDYVPVWEMPSLQQIFEESGFTCKETMDIYFNKNGYNSTKLWADMKAAIIDVYLEKEQAITNLGMRYKSLRNFFEMVRFDFVLDEDLNIYLMEVNMSPNLSSGHFARNKMIYEHVVYNLLSLVGVTRPATKSFEECESDEQDMRASTRDITTFPEWCTSPKCQSDCGLEICSLCLRCLNMEHKVVLKYAHLEHMNRGSCRRVFPPPMSHAEALKWSPDTAIGLYNKLTKKNKLIYMWFIGKCRLDPGWCY